LHDIFKVNAHNKELLQDYFRKRHSVSKLVVHLVFTTKFRRKLFTSVMINNLKAVSSRLLRLQNTHLIRQRKRSVLWSRSYFACPASGATIETLKAYVD